MVFTLVATVAASLLCHGACEAEGVQKSLGRWVVAAAALDEVFRMGMPHEPALVVTRGELLRVLVERA